MAGRTPRAAGRRDAVRRLTIWAAAIAAVLNAVLFVQTIAMTYGAASIQDAIVSAANSLFPRGGLQAPPSTPVPAATPVAVSGGS